MDIISKVLSNVPATQNVTYSCMLTNQWTKANHPEQYPSRSAHWSPPVLAAHSSDYTLWAPGITATDGVKSVAEMGRTSNLEGEIKDAKKAGTAFDFVVGSNQFSSNPPQTLNDIDMTPEFPFLSSITMVAPSPDWFSGFYNFQAIDKSSKMWYESFELASFPWDAGTEQGNRYTLGNDEENPRKAISRLTESTSPSNVNGILLSPDGTTVLPMATWSCTLVDHTCADSDKLKRGKRKRGCEWVKKKKTDKRCKKKWRRQLLSAWCPETCGMCGGGGGGYGQEPMGI